MPTAPAARTLPLVLLLIGCGHARAEDSGGEARGPEPPYAPQEASRAPEPEASPVSTEPTAQVITFSGDDAEPEPTSQIRGAPKRPPIPSFKLYGTRPGDGP